MTPETASAATRESPSLRVYLAAAGWRHDLVGSADAWEYGETASLRVIIWKTAVHVHAFDAQMRHEWTAKFTAGTPDALVIAFLQAAQDGRSA